VTERPRLVGINHVALEVGDIDAALAFWRAIFSFELRGRSDGAAFIDMGDQFIALMRADTPRRGASGDEHRHFGLVVDDRSRVRELARAAGAEMLEGGFLDFRDPWGNFIQVVEYRDIQFTKTEAVLRGMGLGGLEKSAAARGELVEKGMG
jgi:catechol 2,3-dioxygenase-like lactoylglutathione lyase family enzyme